MRHLRTKAAITVILVVVWAARSWAGSASAPPGLRRWTLAADALAAATAATLCLVARSRAGNRRARLGWSLQASGTALWLVVPLALATAPADTLHCPPLVAARASHLALVATGLVITSRGRDPRARVRMLLDGVTVAVSVFVVAWAAVYAPPESGGPTDAQAAAVLAVPVAGVAVVAFALSLTYTEFSPGKRRMPLLYSAGLIAISLADARLGQLSLAAGHPVATVDSGGWTAGFLLVALAAQTYRGTTPRRTEFVAARWIMVAPYGALAAAGAAVVAHVLSTGAVQPRDAVATTVLLVVILVRQMLLLAQNRRLVLELADRHRDLSHAASHDSLTGLGNRDLLLTRLDEALQRTTGQLPPLCLLLCDLDDFKLVNDTLGHQAGDEVLVQVAARLRAEVRTGDSVVRLGGDEFAVLLEAAADDALAVAHGLRLAFQEPFAVDGQPLVLTASIGVAQLAASSATAPTAEQLLRSADLAMYAVKRRGKNDVQVFRPDLDQASPTTDLRTELTRALDTGALDVAFVPIVRTTDGSVVGAEALPTWDDPTGGPVDVQAVLSATGRNRATTRLTEIVLRAAAEATAGWPPGTSAVVQLSAAQLADPRLVERLRRTLATTGADAARLTIEVAETTVQKDVAGVSDALHEIHRLGCRVAIGDFGSGQCALGLLAALPVSLLTLDRALVHDLPRRRELVHAVVAFARSRGLQVAAGSVEHQQHWELAVELGCTLVKGPLVGAAAPANRVVHPVGPRSA